MSASAFGSTSAENVARQIKPPERGGARQRRLVFGTEPQFDATFVVESMSSKTNSARNLAAEFQKGIPFRDRQKPVGRERAATEAHQRRFP